MTEQHAPPHRDDEPTKRARMADDKPTLEVLPNELLELVVSKLQYHVDAAAFRKSNSRMHDVVDNYFSVLYRRDFCDDKMIPDDGARLARSMTERPTAYINYMYGHYWMTKKLTRMRHDELRDGSRAVQRTTSAMWEFVERWALYNIGHLVVDASYCPNTLPRTIGRFGALTILVLRRWDNTHLPDALGDLVQLELLVVSSMRDLVQLPNTLSKLTTLVDLNLSDLPRLRWLPPGLGDLVALRRLRIGECGALGTLPDSAARLTRLERLTLARLPRLQAIPSVVYDMRSLTSLVCMELDVGGVTAQISQLQRLHTLSFMCVELAALPRELGQLSRLRALTVDRCAQFTEVPHEIGQLAPALAELCISGNRALRTLPPEIGKLTNLTRLELGGNAAHMTVPPSIAQLYMALFPTRVQLRVMHAGANDGTWEMHVAT